MREVPHIELNYFYYFDLGDSSDTKAEFKSASQAVTEASSGDSSSSDETDSAGEQLEADMGEAALVLSYLRKVTPEIGREFQVS